MLAHPLSAAVGLVVGIVGSAASASAWAWQLAANEGGGTDLAPIIGGGGTGFAALVCGYVLRALMKGDLITRPVAEVEKKLLANEDRHDAELERIADALGALGVGSRGPQPQRRQRP